MQNYFYYFKFFIVLSLSVLLSSSSFFLLNYLNKQLVNGSYNQVQLTYALSKNAIEALSIKQQLAKKGSQDWFHYTIELAKQRSEQALLLANSYQQKYLSLENGDEKLSAKIIFWYQQAIKLGSSSAPFTLANWFYRQQQLTAAENILSQLTPYSTEQLILYSKVLLDQGKKQQSLALVKEHLSQLKQDQVGKTFLTQLSRYQIDNKLLPSKMLSHVNACDNSIQFFATRLADLVKLEQLIKQFQQHSLADFVCFLPVRYIAISELDCIAKSDVAIRCNEQTWQKQAKSITSKYLGLLLPYGGANVHLGMIYLDSQDDDNIFAHEISHLLGFIDEYSLPKQHPICQQIQKQPFAHNVAILNKSYQGERQQVRKQVLSQLAWANKIKATTPILQAKVEGNDNEWMLGTPVEYNHEMGIFPAETCNKNTIMAFKPVAYQTQLRYNENEFPLVYREQLLNNYDFSMPSFHYNLMLAK